MRMVIAVIITYVGAAIIEVNASEIVNSGDNAQGIPSALSAIVAFIIGFFPKRGIRWFIQRTNDVLGSHSDVSSERPLRRIIGISTWHEARLTEMGIDDAQNLATADIRKLLLTTQFDTQEIIHWIDQAILYIKVGDKLDRFRDGKITTFSELRAVIFGLSVTSFDDLDEDILQERIEAKKLLSSILGLTDPDEMDRIADYSNFPNYIHIAEYYSRIATVARQRANLAMDILMGALEETDYERAAEDGERLLVQNPHDPTLLLRLGTAYYHLDRYEEAKNAYSAAIEIDALLAEAYYSRSVIYADQGNFESAIRDASDAIGIDSTNASAYNNRGLAYMKMKYFDRALADLNKALELDDRLAVAYFNRGIVQNTLGEFGKANKDFEIAYLLGYRSADLWVSWGNAFLGLEQFPEAVSKLSQAVLYDSDLAAAYAKRGYAYLQLGPEYDYQCRSDLKTAIEINSDILTAYTNLGLLEIRNENYPAAIDYYNRALTLNENHFPTRYNLAIAFTKQGDWDDARREFNFILESAPSNSTEAINSLAYLSEIENMNSNVNENESDIGIESEVEDADKKE